MPWVEYKLDKITFEQLFYICMEDSCEKKADFVKACKSTQHRSDITEKLKGHKTLKKKKKKKKMK